jgi:hypothetical protein
MTIKLTKKVGNKEVELDLISLNGETVVRDESFKKSGLTKKELGDMEIGLESDALSKKKK